MTETLLRTEGLTRHFSVGKLMSRQTLHAVDGVDLSIGRGEIVALVGESGSGKSTIARLLARVYKPTSGEIYFDGRPVSNLRTRRQLRVRGHPVRTHHEQRAVAPEDVHTAIGQHGDAATGIGSQLALPELSEAATQPGRSAFQVAGRRRFVTQLGNPVDDRAVPVAIEPG